MIAEKKKNYIQYNSYLQAIPKVFLNHELILKGYISYFYTPKSSPEITSFDTPITLNYTPHKTYFYSPATLSETSISTQ